MATLFLVLNTLNSAPFSSNGITMKCFMSNKVVSKSKLKWVKNWNVKKCCLILLLNYTYNFFTIALTVKGQRIKKCRKNDYILVKSVLANKKLLVLTLVLFFRYYSILFCISTLNYSKIFCKGFTFQWSEMDVWWHKNQ